MRTYTPDEADAILRRFASSLENDQAELAGSYAEDVRTLAVRRADARPTPQAPMIGRVLVARGGSVLAPAGATAHSSTGSAAAGAIAFGAEYGSTLYPQFAPRRASGYFLTPSLEATGDAPGERWIDSILDAAFRGFGIG